MRRLSLVLCLLASCGGDGGGSDGGSSGSGGSAGPDPFDESVLTTYEIVLSSADWDAMVADPGNNTWRRCTVTWQGEFYADVAIRPSGERSRVPGNPKPSLRLEFDEFVPDREFHKYSTLKLDSMIHDQSMMRARLEYPVYVAAGVPAPKYVHCRLIVNGAYKGLYGVEERLGREFVRKRFGEPVGQLYEFRESTEDLNWVGINPSYYVPNMWIPDIADLPWEEDAVQNLVDVLNNSPGQASTVFDVDSFVAFMAAEVLTGEGDAYLSGSDANDAENLFLYRTPSGRYVMLPWDRDQGFYRPENGITFGFDRQILTRNLILNDSAKLASYKQVLRDLIDGPYATAAIQSRIDFILNQIRSAAEQDTLKPTSTQDFIDEVEWIRNTYIPQRNSAFIPQLP